MLGLGPGELMMTTIVMWLFWITPIALIAAFVVFFVKRLNRITDDIGRISQSVQAIESKLTRNEQ